jgi:hypothetical protein
MKLENIMLSKERLKEQKVAFFPQMWKLDL